MVMLGSHEQVHILEYSSSKAIFRKHTSNSMFQNSFRESFHFFCRSRNPLTTGVLGVDVYKRQVGNLGIVPFDGAMLAVVKKESQNA